ncbi:MAG: hypothetical protein JRF32_03860 [Deltaproteobacteria bacterium]|nr:hypothetical protein [Deltaproteobacteria bacterium]MBW2177759.1 hypothetical protein [Deltaproteobacteria bacterium]MBW2296728.1 hypothetical protein [Deltaproteobacteria bacterium]
MKDHVHIEVTFKGKSCLACVYMQETVLDMLPEYGNQVTYSKLDIRAEDGKQRFLALSCTLFGEKGVYEHHRLAPIPALFIDGELIFDAIPSRDALEEAIAERLQGRPEKSNPGKLAEKAWKYRYTDG